MRLKSIRRSAQAVYIRRLLLDRCAGGEDALCQNEEGAASQTLLLDPDKDDA